MTTRRVRRSSTQASTTVTQCPWPTTGDALYLAYHDEEWGVRSPDSTFARWRFGRRDVARLLKDEGIVLNRQKIEAAITNAQRLPNVRAEYGTFETYMWSWVKGKPIVL